MGESHATVLRSAADRGTLLAAAAAYQEVYGDPEDGSVPASFQIIYLTGWSPHDSQQRPLARGSGGVSLKDLNLPGFLPQGADGGGNKLSGNVVKGLELFESGRGFPVKVKKSEQGGKQVVKATWGSLA